MSLYTEHFFEGNKKTQHSSSAKIVPILMDLFSPCSVVDVGCSVGEWLSAFEKAGVSKIQGTDGEWLPLEKLVINPDNFIHSNLSEIINIQQQRFDLALSLEVAEHLPEQRAEGFIAELCSLAPVIYFSAAIPQQGGTGHLNEQWPEYWQHLFAQHDYIAFDSIRPKVWNMADVAWWYAQNSVLYIHRSEHNLIASLGESSKQLTRLVHPELFRKKCKLAEPSFGRWLKGGKKALYKSISKCNKPQPNAKQ